MDQWTETMKTVSGVLGSVVALSSLAGIFRNRWKAFTNTDNARRGNPALLVSYIELYAKIPTYVPARDELLATIQEMTLDIALDPERVKDRRESRHQLYSMAIGVFMLVVGLPCFGFGYLKGDFFIQFVGVLMLLCGPLYMWVLPFSMAAASKRDAARVKAKRAVFIKEHKWPDEAPRGKAAEGKGPGLRDRIVDLALRIRSPFPKRDQDQASDGEMSREVPPA